MRDIFTTISGNHSVGINAPQMKAEPSDTTLTIPVIAPLLFVRLDIKRAIVNVQKVNTKVFKAYISPLNDNIVSFKTNIPNITYKSHTAKAYIKLALSILIMLLSFHTAYYYSFVNFFFMK